VIALALSGCVVRVSAQPARAAACRFHACRVAVSGSATATPALEDGHVRIAQAAIQPNHGQTFDGDPKARSNRTLTLPDFMLDEIEHHLRTYVGRSPNAYVFLGPKGARPTRADFHRIWSKERAKVGVRISICTTCGTPVTPWPPKPARRSAS
jgi:hypothetical protein